MMRRLFNSLWILFLGAIGFATVIAFAYLFLFYEDLHSNGSASARSVEDDLVADDRSWIKHVLSSGEHGDSFNHVMYSRKYGQYLFLEKHCDQILSKSSPKFTKLVFIVIDALRVDFVPSILNPDSNSAWNMPYAEQLLATHGLGLQSIASIPTVTLARVKALLSGCLPSFMDYIMNLNAYAFKSDNIVLQLSKREKRIVFYGDDTWGKLFNASVFLRMNLTSSLYAKDYTEVDTNVTYNVDRDLRHLDGWDAMMLHYLGVDHIGHLYGDRSDLLPAKFIEMDNVFQRIFDTLSVDVNQSYLIVITGDHGMTKVGNHGGNTRDETHTALLFFSTNKSHIYPNGYRRFAPLADRTVLQIDIATTIATLFGLPIPARSQGRIISPILERFDIAQSEHLCALHRNALHVQRLIDDDRASQDETDKTETLKTLLLDAISYHYLHAYNNNNNNTNNNNVDDNFASRADDDPDSRQYQFERSRNMYQKFIAKIQRYHVKKATNRSFFSLQTLVIVVCYAIIAALLYIEYSHNPASICFNCTFSFANLFCLDEWLPSPFAASTSGNGGGGEQTLDFGNIPFYFSHLRFYASTPARCVMIAFFALSLIAMGSTNFMEYEHLFWHNLASFLLVVSLIIAIRGYFNLQSTRWRTIAIFGSHYRRTIINLIAAIILLKLMLYWKIPLINEDDAQLADLYSWLSRRESKLALTRVYIIAVIAIAVLTSTKSTFGRPPGIFVSALFCVYLYRSSSGSIASFRIEQIPAIIVAQPNTYAQIVYWHALIIAIYCFVHKCKWLLPMRNRYVKISIEMLCSLMYTDKTSFQRSAFDCDTLLHAFLLVWVFLSALLLEPPFVPILAGNIALEKLVYATFRSAAILERNFDSNTGSSSSSNRNNYHHRTMFYRLGTYTVFAYSAFYQIGNTNSLSTVNVNACFVGMNAYSVAPCAALMIISIYSTFVYWFTMFFVRLQQDLMSSNIAARDNDDKKNDNDDEDADDDDEDDLHQDDVRTNSIHVDCGNRSNTMCTRRLLSRRFAIIRNYCTFHSVTNCMLIGRMCAMAANMTVTFALRDHLFIWSVICPKLLYEIIFTAITLAIAIVMSVIFTHDNYFQLH